MCGLCYLLGLKVYKARTSLVFFGGLAFGCFWFWLALPWGKWTKPLETVDTFNISDIRRFNIPIITELRVKWITMKIDKLSSKMEKLNSKKVHNVKEMPQPDERVQIFYYSWFSHLHIHPENTDFQTFLTAYDWLRNMDEDGSWNHWEVEPWHGRNSSTPPREIDSAFYPTLGCYSSRNSTVIDKHMRMIRKAGIGVIILSWVPPPSPDSPVTFLHNIMELAGKHNLKVVLQIESYENRTIKGVLNQIKFFISKYGNHPAVYKYKKNSKKLPVFYIHETFQIGHLAWKRLFSGFGNSTVRGTLYDGVFLAHLTEQHQGTLLKAANFDGFYTYSSSNGLSYGSSWKNWESLRKYAKEKKMIFVPCIGPGYKYDKGHKDSRERLHGDYYEVGWRSALAVKPELIGINSFNNWQAGNQIEPAAPKKSPTRTYSGYQPEGELFYLNLTLWWVKKFSGKE